MTNSNIQDPLFRQAVAAIDAGDTEQLKALLASDPGLVAKRIDTGEKGYFSRPYLLWFVAGNPIRQDKMPASILSITQLLIDNVRKAAAESLHEQLDYTLGLVVTGRIPKECGVQIELMDVLLDAGARPGKAHGAIAHGNLEAAAHLIERGAEPTLLSAICLDNKEDIDRLLKISGIPDRELALVAAAFLGKAGMLALLLKKGTGVNNFPAADSGFHSHATALHQAVYSGSLEAVTLLVEAGADLSVRDKIYGGTAIEWCRHMHEEAGEETIKEKYAAVENYLAQKAQ